jgi:hypothetical protein
VAGLRASDPPKHPFLIPSFHQKARSAFLFYKFYKFRRKSSFVFNKLQAYRGEMQPEKGEMQPEKGEMQPIPDVDKGSFTP